MKTSRFIPGIIMPLVIAINGYAQPQFGVKAGANFASIKEFNGDGRTSVYAGLYVRNSLDKQWSLQPELLFSGEGVRYNVEGVQRTIALHYIALPVMVQYRPAKHFILEAGPRIAVLTDAQSKGDGGDHLNVKRSFRSGQFGIDMGIEIQCSSAISLQGRYSLGLTDLTLYDDTQNTGRVISVGIVWQLKKISL